MLLIFSANANDSPQIRREVERAVSKGVAVLPLRIQDIKLAHPLEYFIGTVHWLDALTPPLEGHLLRLADSVKTLLQVDPVPPRIVPPPIVGSVAPTARTFSSPFVLAALGGLAVLVTGGIGLGVWWQLVAKEKIVVQAPPPPSTALAAPISVPVEPKIEVDAAIIGTWRTA
jgi:hypothetical protein